jgi:hypothetical protein
MSFRRVTGGIIRNGGTCSVTRVGGTRSRATAEESHYYPELPPTVSASITSSAISTIRAEIKDALKGMECGGFLVAHPDSPDHIVAATGEGVRHDRLPNERGAFVQASGRERRFAATIRWCSNAPISLKFATDSIRR